MYHVSMYLGVMIIHSSMPCDSLFFAACFVARTIQVFNGFRQQQEQQGAAGLLQVLCTYYVVAHAVRTWGLSVG